jgi:hypothetical protein
VSTVQKLDSFCVFAEGVIVFGVAGDDKVD